MLCQRKVSIRNKEVLSHQKVKVLQLDQFEEATGSVYRALSDVLRMFQIWACKQVCIAGLLAQTRCRQDILPITVRNAQTVELKRRHLGILQHSRSQVLVELTFCASQLT